MEGCSRLPPEGYDDDGRLELCLGLSLGGAKSKRKTSEGSNQATTSGDASTGAGAVTAATASGSNSLVGDGPVGKQKYGRGSGLDAALKKFLEGRLDEQEETGKVLDGYPHQEGAWELSSNPDKGGCSSSSASPPGSHSNTRFPAGEVQSQVTAQSSDSLEQQRKWQEARKKRKNLIEEQKQQKKVKKEEDRPGPHGFRRPGSNTWVRGLDACDAERAFLPLAESEESEPGPQGSPYDDQRVLNDKKLENHEKDTEPSGQDSKGVEVNFMPQLKLHATVNTEGNDANEDVQQSNANIPVNGKRDKSDSDFQAAPSVCNERQEGDFSNASCQKMGGPSNKEKNSCQSSSTTQTEHSEKKDTQSCGGDAEVSSAPSASAGIDASNVSTGTLLFSSATPTSTNVTYSLTSPSMIRMPYSVPIPMSTMTAVPFPAGYSFPYVMPGATQAQEGHEQISTLRAFGGSPYQSQQVHPHSPAQDPVTEGAPPWLQLMRPPAGSPLRNPIYGVTRSRAVEEENSKNQGLKMVENGTLHAPVAASGTSTSGGHSLSRDVDSSIAAFPQPRQAPDLKFLSSLPVSGLSHIGPGDFQTLKEQVVNNAFPGFAAAAQAAQGMTGFLKAPNVGEEVASKQDQSRIGFGYTNALQQVLRSEDAASVHINDVGQEDFGTALGDQFHRGSTDNLSSSEGWPQELVGLRPGIPAGMKFGGTGSAPELPWVYTTGSGGRTVSGVLYKFSRNQLRIVCACHGKHMSPTEFVQHAGNVDTSSSEKNLPVNVLPLAGNTT